MQLSTLYLLSGVFFQEQIGTRLGYDFQGDEDLTVFLESGIGEFLFTGVLQRDPNHLLGSYKGTMVDGLGHAHLRNVVISNTELRFEKYYDHGRPHAQQINYFFRREHDLEWVGKYLLVNTEIQGPTRCILHPITPAFFRHDLIPQHSTRRLTDALRERLEEVED